MSGEDKGIILVVMDERIRQEGRRSQILTKFYNKRSLEMKHLEKYVSLRNIFFCFNLEGISKCIYQKNEVIKGGETILQSRKMRQFQD